MDGVNVKSEFMNGFPRVNPTVPIGFSHPRLHNKLSDTRHTDEVSIKVTPSRGRHVLKESTGDILKVTVVKIHESLVTKKKK